MDRQTKQVTPSRNGRLFNKVTRVYSILHQALGISIAAKRTEVSKDMSEY